MTIYKLPRRAKPKIRPSWRAIQTYDDRVAICQHGTTGLCMYCLTWTIEQTMMQLANLR